MIPKTIVSVSTLLALCSWNVAGDENYVCSQAIRIFVDGDAVNDTTSHSIPDTLDNFDAPCFDSFSDKVGASARWYVISGNGGVIRANACSNVGDFEAAISIYRGDCENLECVERDLLGYCDSPDMGSGTEWETEESVDYYIRIFGYNVFGFTSGSGDFRLEAQSFEPLMNDFCDGAIALTNATEFPTLAATNYSFPDYVYCGQDIYHPYNTMIWYSVLGTGGALSVSSCSNSYTPNLHIFSGTCEKLECVAHSVRVDGICEEQAIFSTEVNKQYFILVGWYDDYDSDRSFELIVSDIEIVPQAVCSGAIELLPDTGTTTGSLTNTSAIGPSAPCSDHAGNRGVWYSLMGTGDVFIISTCSVELSFAAAIQVSSGGCDNHECVTFGYTNYWECSLSFAVATKVIFKSEIGVQYYVVVDEAGGGSGDGFGLTVTSAKVPPDTLCSNPWVAQPDSGAITGWITNVTGLMEDSYSDPNRTVGAWFSLVGTGDTYDITTCSSNLNFGSAIRIFNGKCEDLQLIASSDTWDDACDHTRWLSARVVLPTERGVNYRIFVEAVGELPDIGGEYGLTISTVEVRPTYVCSGAREIQPDNGTIQGSLADVSNFSNMNYACSPSADAPSAWFSLQGTGEIYAFSTCSRQLNFDSMISVSTGPCHDQLCTMYNSSIDLDCSDSDYVAYRVVVPTEIGVTYWIAIQGLTLNTTSQGQFGLTVSSVLPSPDGVILNNDGLDFLSGVVANHNRGSQNPVPTNAPTGEGVTSNTLFIGPDSSSASKRWDLFPSLIFTMSIGIVPSIMTLWLS